MVGFRDYSSGLSEIDTILNDFREFATDKDEFKLYTLKLLEHFHWISVDNVKNFQFRFHITEENNPLELKIALDTFKKIGNVKSKNGIYYLE